MSNFIVLVKQVPDVSRITDNVFHPETGTLMRNKLPSVINDLDAQAFAFAMRMRETSGSGRVVCLTMGPPNADEVLRYGLARGADSGVLLTDRLLGGADTWATANPLAFAIRRIVREHFQGQDDYYVVAGMQSVDGDTAQVPAQVAEELGLPCVAYATDLEYVSGRFRFTRIISGGSQIVSPRRLPCVVTVAKYEHARHAGFSAARRARRAALTVWGAADIKPAACGAAGSKTRVVKVFPPGKTSRKCLHLADMASFVRALAESMKSAAPGAVSAAEHERYVLPAHRPTLWERPFEVTEKETGEWLALGAKVAELGLPGPGTCGEAERARLAAAVAGRFDRRSLDMMLNAAAKPDPYYRGDVWVVAEHSGGEPIAAVFELVGKARGLADCLGVRVGVVVPGKGIGDMSPGLIAAGADEVHLVESSWLEDFDPAAYRKAVGDVIAAHWPQIVLFAATPQGRVLAPMISYRLGCGLTADCTGLEIRDHSRRSEIGILAQTRPALGGNVMATICTMGSRSQMATARPGVMRRLSPDPARTGRVLRHDPGLSAGDLSLEIIRTETAQGRVNLAGSQIIVSGGRGLRSRADYEQMLDDLAGALQRRLGAGVEKGASRAAVEQGYAERMRQVGQTGTSVAPRIYLALGISGAIQHMIGIANAETIFAVNSDPHAPIFKACDYYMVGKVEDVLPQLMRSLGEGI